MDFSNLNQAYPKDNFSLPWIDQLVDFTAGHELLSFKDANSNFNQIPMYTTDEENTSFIIDQDLNYYKMISFGMQNVGATYQRLVNRMLANLMAKFGKFMSMIC